MKLEFWKKLKMRHLFGKKIKDKPLILQQSATSHFVMETYNLARVQQYRVETKTLLWLRLLSRGQLVNWAAQAACLGDNKIFQWRIQIFCLNICCNVKVNLLRVLVQHMLRIFIYYLLLFFMRFTLLTINLQLLLKYAMWLFQML